MNDTKAAVEKICLRDYPPDVPAEIDPDAIPSLKTLFEDAFRDHVGDQTDEPVARGTADAGRVRGGARALPGMGGQLGPVHGEPPGGVAVAGQDSGIDEAADGVITDPEQPGGLTNSKMRHTGDNRSAFAESQPSLWSRNRFVSRCSVSVILVR